MEPEGLQHQNHLVISPPCAGPLTFGDTMEFGRRDILTLPGLVGTVDILEFLCEHETARYMDFDIPASYHSLNTRLKQMLDMGLIEHHLTRDEARREWYTITERGKEYLRLIHAQLDLFKS